MAVNMRVDVYGIGEVTTMRNENIATRSLDESMEHRQDVGHKEPLKGGEAEYLTSDEDVSFFHDFIAGGVAGSVSVVVGHPFDTIKVSMPPVKCPIS